MRGKAYDIVGDVFAQLVRHTAGQHDALAFGIIPPRGARLDAQVERVGRGVKTE